MVDKHKKVDRDLHIDQLHSLSGLCSTKGPIDNAKAPFTTTVPRRPVIAKTDEAASMKGHHKSELFSAPAILSKSYDDVLPLLPTIS